MADAEADPPTRVQFPVVPLLGAASASAGTRAEAAIATIAAAVAEGRANAVSLTGAPAQLVTGS